eukprot:jgi/Psemu1/9293/gm1.9293_g
MEKVYNLALRKIDNNSMETKLKGMADWKDINTSKSSTATQECPEPNSPLDYQGFKLYGSMQIDSHTRSALSWQEMVGLPTVVGMIQMIDNNLVNDSMIAHQDIKIITDIYGKHTSISKDISPVPEFILDTYKDITLFVVNLEIHQIQNSSSNQQYEGEDTTTEQCKDNYRAVYIQMIQTDQHETAIERNNRTLKENIRCWMNHIPTTCLPTRCLIELVYAMTFWLNCQTTGDDHLDITIEQLETNDHSDDDDATDQSFMSMDAGFIDEEQTITKSDKTEQNNIGNETGKEATRITNNNINELNQTEKGVGEDDRAGSGDEETSVNHQQDLDNNEPTNNG